MKERGGLAATIAILLATIFGISYLPRRAADTSAPQDFSKTTARGPSGGASGKQAAAPGPKPIASCEQIAKRLRRYYAVNESVPVPVSCYPEGTQPPQRNEKVKNPQLSFAIAIVPNPVQTHLPLVFDRAVESVSQAAQDVNYIYDGSWFPWNHSEKSYELLSDEEQAAKLESELQQQPGIIVFRRSLDGEAIGAAFQSCTDESGEINPLCPDLNGNDLLSHYEHDLVVFVVAEQPTGGLNDTQFEHALQWMQAIQPEQTDQPLLILGPTFSGTLPSLARELTPAALKPYGKGAQIYSGTANSESGVRWFQLYLANTQAELQKNSPLAKLQFRTFFEGDSLMTNRFLCYLQHEGYDLERVAILSEDETAFGNVGKPSKKTTSPLQCNGGAPRPPGQAQTPVVSPVYLFYPRNIASLRSAYEQQSIFSAGKSQAKTLLPRHFEVSSASLSAASMTLFEPMGDR